MKSGYSVADVAFRELRGVVSCRNQGKHAVNREEFADDFHTSSLSINDLVVFPAMQVERFPLGNDLEAKRTDRLAEILSTSSRRGLSFRQLRPDP